MRQQGNKATRQLATRQQVLVEVKLYNQGNQKNQKNHSSDKKK